MCVLGAGEERDEGQTVRGCRRWQKSVQAGLGRLCRTFGAHLYAGRSWACTLMCLSMHRPGPCPLPCVGQLVPYLIHTPTHISLNKWAPADQF